MTCNMARKLTIQKNEKLTWQDIYEIWQETLKKRQKETQTVQPRIQRETVKT